MRHKKGLRTNMKEQVQIPIIWMLAVVMIPLLVFPSNATAQDWPREIVVPEGKVVIYQPQLESFEGNKLEALAAVSVTRTGETNPVFGAVWVSARVSTDRDTRTVTLLDIKVTAAKFPNANEENLDKLSRLLEREVPKWDLSLSLDRLLTSLDLVEKERETDKNLKTIPPKIIFETSPAVLVMIDGEPRLQDVEKTELRRVINTPFLVVFETKKKTYYLKGGEKWYSAQELMGPWKIDSKPPKSAVKLAEQGEEAQPEKTEEDKKAANIVPKIIVSTEPAELILADGEPEYKPITGTELLYMNNTDNDVIMDINSQKTYVLLAGRWYTSSSLTDGKWSYIPSDKLPDDFAKIPAGSEIGNVRASVAGTQEAQEAVLENEIPQTAAVDRKEAKLTVEYDGEPKFKKIEETEISYAVNTSKSVLLIDKKYYCCDEAVWFLANNPKGPWEVCDSVPEEIRSIPPSSPVYSVKYVYVYDSTPDVVYVGYTPGYYGSYIYGGCVVYGTGWYYPPWYGIYYYPRPVTYGFGVHWNPYTGWGFAFGVSYGWLTIGWATYPGYHSWWGPAGYHHGYRHGYYHGYYAGRRAGFRAGYQYRPHTQNNIYRKRPGIQSTGNRMHTMDRQTGAMRKATPGVQPQNNVFADRNGNVYRKSGDQWQVKDKSGWSSNNTKINQNKSQLNLQNKARSQGTARTNSFNRARTTSRRRR